MRRTKIVCTIGPPTATPAQLEQLINAGMNVARLNFSHGTHDEKKAIITAIRAIARRLNKPVAILQDLAGPKIRTGPIANGPVELTAGQEFTLTNRAVPGDATAVSLTYTELPRDVRPGDSILLCDGALELEVESATETDIKCRVTVGGPLNSHKGSNLPGRSIRAPILNEKDRADLAFGIEQDVDYVAMSFIRSAADVLEIRQFVRDHNGTVPLIAKIEKHEALDRIDEIIPVVDGIMVARGDLGVEIPIEQVPGFQKMLIEKTNRAGKPVITATQMLKSMVDNPRPTRAEVTDVANAILDGSDAVMLSEETASGNYPIQAVQVMARVAVETEKNFPYEAWTYKFGQHPKLTLQEAVAQSACELAESIDAPAIVTCTMSGSTTRMVAKYRPGPLLIAMTPNERTYRQLALVWGCVPTLMGACADEVEMEQFALRAALANCLVKKGDTIVFTAGLPLQEIGTTNMIKVVRVT